MASGLTIENLELLVYIHIDILQRRLYAEKHREQAFFEMRYSEYVPFLEGSPAHAR